ncbi:MAG: kelch repeat-containing protein [Tepidisphaeraceae bacterium]
MSNRRAGALRAAAQPVIEALEVRRHLHAGHEHPAIEINVNFQPEASTTVPAGYIADIGRLFGKRANGRTYGWSASNESQMRERHMVADQRYDTLAHFAGKTWEIALPNGAYAVRLISGDPQNFDSIYRTNVEGVLTVDGTPTSANRWLEGTATVSVTDGRLTIGNADGAINNKIDFVQIQSVEAPPAEVTITAPDPNASESGKDTGTFTIARDVADTSAPLVVQFDVSGTATNGVDYGITGNAITIPAGQSSFTFKVKVIGDTLAEGNETMILTLADIGTYTIGTAGPAATVTIADGGAVLAGPFKANVDFQPYDAQVPPGYVVDGGAAYGRRANGLTYGWNRDKIDSTRDRDSSNAPDQRYDTFNSFGDDDWWAIKVPNGTYQVRVVAGDPSNFNSHYAIDVEGVEGIDAKPTSSTRFLQETRIVLVEDGTLTLTSGEGADNNKIAFVEILRVADAAAPPGAPRALAATADSSSSAQLTWNDHANNEVGFKIERRRGSGSWKQLALLPADTNSFHDKGLDDATRYEYRVRAYNGAGRSSWSTNGTTTFIEFPTDIAWKAVAPSPVERAEALGGVYNDKLYVFGGLFTPPGQILGMTRSDVYNPATNKWTRLADMPEKVTHAGVVRVGDVFWFVGGYVGDHPGPGYDHVWKYDVSENAWSRGPDLPANRGAGSAVLIDNKIHFVGGLDETRGADKADHWVLDLDEQSEGWKRRKSLPAARNHTSAVSLGGYMYVIGGQLDEEELQEPLSSVYRYDPETDDWDRMKDLPAPRSHTNSSTFVMNGRIVVLGGEDGFGAPHRTVYAYDPATDSWTRLSDLPATRSTSVAGVLSGNRIISATGNSPIPTTTTWIGTVS